MAVAEYPIPLVRDPARTVEPTAIRTVRIYFLILSALCLAAFVFGIENRFTRAGLFFLPIPVELIPPLSPARWFEAYALHQQDPVFIACGGTTSFEEFQILYGWEWLRRASLFLLAGGMAAGLAATLFSRRFRFALPRLAGFYLLVLAGFAAHALTEFAARADALANLNVGQYRHAADLTFASLVTASVIAAAAFPPLPFAARRPRPFGRFAWLWIGAIVLDLAFGALFAACNAAAFWPDWPLYEGHALPPLTQLFSLSPWWLNLTANYYMIQLVHRLLSAGLWIAALILFALSVRRDHADRNRAFALFLLLTAQMATGIAALVLGTPAGLSILHQLGGIFVLAGALVLLRNPAHAGER